MQPFTKHCPSTPTQTYISVLIVHRKPNEWVLGVTKVSALESLHEWTNLTLIQLDTPVGIISFS